MVTATAYVTGVITIKKTERLEVRLSPVHYDLLQREAERQGVSMGSLVREAVEEKYGDQQARRAQALQHLMALNAPVADWEQMEKEIEKGRLE